MNEFENYTMESYTDIIEDNEIIMESLMNDIDIAMEGLSNIGVKIKTFFIRLKRKIETFVANVMRGNKTKRYPEKAITNMADLIGAYSKALTKFGDTGKIEEYRSTLEAINKSKQYKELFNFDSDSFNGKYKIDYGNIVKNRLSRINSTLTFVENSLLTSIKGDDRDLQANAQNVVLSETSKYFSNCMSVIRAFMKTGSSAKSDNGNTQPGDKNVVNMTDYQK